MTSKAALASERIFKVVSATFFEIYFLTTQINLSMRQHGEAAAMPPINPSKLRAEGNDLERKIRKIMAELTDDRINAKGFVTRTGSVFGEFFKRMENCFSEEVLAEAFPSAFPFEDLRADFQDRIDELFGESRDQLIDGKMFDERLLRITEEFLEKLTDTAA